MKPRQHPSASPWWHPEKLCCLLAAPLYVFGEALSSQCFAGVFCRSKAQTAAVARLGERGLPGCSTHLPSSTDHPCAPAALPVPSIPTKLLMSSGCPHGQPGASAHDLVLNYCPASASFVWAAESPGSALFRMAARAARGEPSPHHRRGDALQSLSFQNAAS